MTAAMNNNNTTNNDRSLSNEFEMETSARDDGSSPRIPPPPRDDCEENDSDIGSGVCSSTENDDEVFGDESMSLLMDAENSVKSPSCDQSGQSLNNDSGGMMSVDGDDDVSELSDGAASLLRGPIMAARSVAQAMKLQQVEQRQYWRQHSDDVKNHSAPSKVRITSPSITKTKGQESSPLPSTDTPSATRNEFIPSAQKLEPWSPWSLQHQKKEQEASGRYTTTPSAARVKFIPSARKDSYDDEVHKTTTTTPSTTRREFIQSALKSEEEETTMTQKQLLPWSPWSTAQQNHHPEESGKMQQAAAATRLKFFPSSAPELSNYSPSPPGQHCTPSTARSGFISPPEKTKWPKSSSSSSTTTIPSSIASSSSSLQSKAKVQNSADIGSSSSSLHHQDSVSSLGANSPSAHVVAQSQQVQMQRVGSSHQTPPNVTLTEVTNTALTSSPSFEICKRKSPVSEEAEAFLRMNKRILNNKNNKGKTLENVIELGERQMKLGAASARAAASNHDDDETSNLPIPTKRPFLRKGTRKEPSALHTRRDILNNSAAIMTTSTMTATAATSHDVTTAMESASDRKARLEKLEKMQEDLMKDLDRRRIRKEKAQRERRREMTMKKEKESDDGVVLAASESLRRELLPRSGGGSYSCAARSAARSPNETTLQSHQARPDSSRGNKIDGDEELTSSQVQLKSTISTTTTKKSPFITKGTESKMKPSLRGLSVSPTPTVEGKSLPGRNNKAKTIEIDTNKSTKSPQMQISATRSTSRPRSSTQRRSTIKTDKPSSSTDFDSKAMEEMKRKEEEQMALIQNMRRRQEAALREAEGERERAKAWAAAEKESVKKWVDEQRALIRKDRHKAANAALIASRRASGRGRIDEANDNDDHEEDAALKSELEELRLEMKRIKVEAEEASRLREQVRKQERLINSLKQGEAPRNKNINDGNGGGGGDKIAPRTVLRDRTLKENVQQRPKTSGNTTARDDRNKQRGATKEQPIQEPADSENNLINNQALQRKPYNAADYDGKTQASPSPPDQGDRPSQIVTYENGTTKEVLPDGTITISFANGDRKRTYANEKKGIEVYYYATTQVRVVV